MSGPIEQVEAMTELLEKAQRRGDQWMRMEETMRADRDRADQALKQAEQRANALQAVLARIGQMADAWEQRLPATISTATAVDAIRTALEHADTAPPLDHHQILDRAIARLKAVPVQCTALTGPAWYGSGWKDAIGEFEEYAWRLDPLPESALVADPPPREERRAAFLRGYERGRERAKTSTAEDVQRLEAEVAELRQDRDPDGLRSRIADLQYVVRGWERRVHGTPAGETETADLLRRLQAAQRELAELKGVQPSTATGERPS